MSLSPAEAPTVPIPDPAIPLPQQPDEMLLAMCIFGEARGEHDDAKLAVGNVVRNRVLAGRYGKDWRGVILRPMQFSCFNTNDPNSKKVVEPLKYGKQETWETCYRIASWILNGTAKDNTQRSTHYFDKSLDANPPYWSYGFIPTVTIGGLRFYRDPMAFRYQNDIEAELFGEV